MEIKLIKETNGTAIGSIVDVDEITAKKLIDEKSAIAYTDEVKATEQKSAIKEAVKNININIHKEKENKNMKTEEYVIGKFLKSLTTNKAVTGMSEGTAADGGNVVTTALGELMGIAMDNSKVWSKCRKITLPDQANAIKVPVDASDPWIKATVPVPTNPAEGAQKTATKLAFGAQTLTLGKTVLYIPVTDELLQDVGMLDQFVRQYAKSKLAGVLDYEVLVGGNGGYDGITGNSGYCSSCNITEATPTVAELYAMVAAIDPRLRDGAEWFVANGQWTNIVAALATEKNLVNNSILDLAGMKLFGMPVTVMACMNAEIILGNLSQYTVAVPRMNDIVTVSEHIRFDYDETVYRLVHRGAGDITWGLRTAGDSTTVGAFAESA
jgi:HK97 family phage major capsid protein